MTVRFLRALYWIGIIICLFRSLRLVEPSIYRGEWQDTRDRTGMDSAGPINGTLTSMRMPRARNVPRRAVRSRRWRISRTMAWRRRRSQPPSAHRRWNRVPRPVFGGSRRRCKERSDDAYGVYWYSLSRRAMADWSCLNSSSIEIAFEVCHIVLLPELEAATTTTAPILVPRSGVFLHRSIFPLPSLVPVRSLRRSCIYSYGLAFKVA